jgi:multidrug efflux pump subunit AcrA (membrane-fusion protein)
MRVHLAVVVFLATAVACKHANSEKAEEQEKPGSRQALQMAPQAQGHIGLQVAPAAVQELKEYLEVPGTVQAIDSRIGHVRSLAKGRLQSILVKVGDRVSQNGVRLKDNIVFIKTGDTTFEMRKVQVGRTVNQITEITAGLRPGEHVVSAGSFHLKAMVQGGELGEKE